MSGTELADPGGVAAGRPDGDGGPLDRYLDELFDRLAGTGTAGRRALAEAEDHLRTSAAQAQAAGASREEAERQAVERFGPPASLARQLRRSISVAGLPALLSGAWLIAGIVLTTAAVAFLGNAAGAAMLLRARPEPLPPCPPVDPAYPFVGECSPSVPIIWNHVRAGLVLAALTALVLGGRWLVRRYTRLPAADRRTPATAAIVLAVLAAAYFMDLPDTVAGDAASKGAGVGVTVVYSLVCAVAALSAACVWLVTRRRRARYRT